MIACGWTLLCVLLHLFDVLHYHELQTLHLHGLHVLFEQSPSRQAVVILSADLNTEFESEQLKIVW